MNCRILSWIIANCFELSWMIMNYSELSDSITGIYEYIWIYMGITAIFFWKSSLIHSFLGFSSNKLTSTAWPMIFNWLYEYRWLMLYSPSYHTSQHILTKKWGLSSSTVLRESPLTNWPANFLRNSQFSNRVWHCSTTVEPEHGLNSQPMAGYMVMGERVSGLYSIISSKVSSNGNYNNGYDMQTRSSKYG